MALDKNSLAKLYAKRAGKYDFTANAYYLLGFREFAYRKAAIRALNLKRGDTVVEIGCGTGLNFSHLIDCIGPEGKLIGVDLTPEMLKQADDRIRRNSWTNVELVRQDAAMYTFPNRVDGILSSFALTLIPEYDVIVKNGLAALGPGRRFAVLDFKKPELWPSWLIQFFVPITRPFGVSLDLTERHPWESIARYADSVEFLELYFGAVYLCIGEKHRDSAPWTLAREVTPAAIP
jgi:demethylmenaquinone methyltransferase/2-methoxy-6-polyprenyl-1,4-benzoquinol methylase